MISNNTEVIIVGGGMVGLSIAKQLIERGLVKSNTVTIIEKEKFIGKHSSGRNSGVLHAGIYYKPGSLKAKVCVNGAKRLKKWIEDRNLPINKCGKIILAQNKSLDKQIDLLFRRGTENNAEVEIWDAKKLKNWIPEVKPSSNRVLWSPNTVVVKPKLVLFKLFEELKELGVKFIFEKKIIKVDKSKKLIYLSDGESFNFDFLFNSAGLYADKIAHLFDIGKEFKLIPFKGLYWQLKDSCNINIPTNIYPVPDLEMPFLGVHFTPSADDKPLISIGPTATLALGRENYYGLDNIELFNSISNINLLVNKYINNKDGFRGYFHDQALLALRPFLLNEAKKIIPNLKNTHIEKSEKVGIRSQLFNKKTKLLVDDFVCIKDSSCVHVLNAISPAFTASFALADLIIDQA